jgi:hypothetical protein
MRNKAKKVSESVVNITSYVGLLLQFAWMIMLYISWAVQSGALQAYIDATGTSSTQPSLDIAIPELFRGPLSVVVLSSIVFITVYLIRRTPQLATEVTIRATERTAKTVRPVLKKAVHSPKARNKITPTLVLFLTKIVGSLILLVLTVFAHGLVTLDTTLTSMVTITLFAFTAIALLIHQSIVFSSHIRYRRRSH